MGTYTSSECPPPTASSSARSWGGGGAFDRARQKRHSITHGSNQLCTCRRATGHDRGGRSISVSSSFFPHFLRHGLRPWYRIDGCHLLVLSRARPPAERKGAQDQLPMAADGLIGAHLKIGEAQFSLDLLVALLHPHPQTVEPYHLLEIRRRKLAFLGSVGTRSGQIRRQIPAAVGGQRGRIGGYRHQAHRLLRTVAHKRLYLRCPPSLFASVPKAPDDGSPLSRIFRRAPPKPVGGLLGGVRRLHFGPPPLVGPQAQNIGYFRFPQFAFEVRALPVNGIGHYSPKRDARFSGPVDQSHPDLRFGAESGIGPATGQTLRRLIRLDVQRIVNALVGPHATHRHDPVGDPAHGAQVLMRHVRRLLAVLTITGLVDDEDAISMRLRRRIFPEQL